MRYYRLKPFVTKDILNNAYPVGIVDLMVLLRDPDIACYARRNTLEEEKSIFAFQQIDEKEQLRTIFELYRLEKRKRKLEEQLEVLKKNSSISLNEESIEAYWNLL